MLFMSGGIAAAIAVPICVCIAAIALGYFYWKDKQEKRVSETKEVSQEPIEGFRELEKERDMLRLQLEAIEKERESISTQLEDIKEDRKRVIEQVEDLKETNARLAIQWEEAKRERDKAISNELTKEQREKEAREALERKIKEKENEHFIRVERMEKDKERVEKDKERAFAQLEEIRTERDKLRKDLEEKVKAIGKSYSQEEVNNLIKHQLEEGHKKFEKIDQFFSQLGVFIQKSITREDLEKNTNRVGEVYDIIQRRVDFYQEHSPTIKRWQETLKGLGGNISNFGSKYEAQFKELFNMTFSERERELIDYKTHPRSSAESQKAADVEIIFYSHNSREGESEKIFSVIIELKTHFEKDPSAAEKNKNTNSVKKIAEYTKTLFKKYKDTSDDYSLFLLVTDEDWRASENKIRDIEKKRQSGDLVWFQAIEDYTSELNIDLKEARTYIHNNPGPKFAIANPTQALSLLKHIFHLVGSFKTKVGMLQHSRGLWEATEDAIYDWEAYVPTRNEQFEEYCDDINDKFSEFKKQMKNKLEEAKKIVDQLNNFDSSRNTDVGKSFANLSTAVKKLMRMKSDQRLLSLPAKKMEEKHIAQLQEKINKKEHSEENYQSLEAEEEQLEIKEEELEEKDSETKVEVKEHR